MVILKSINDFIEKEDRDEDPIEMFNQWCSKEGIVMPKI